MPLHAHVHRCTHIKVTGHRCGSPALKGECFCYFHTRMIKGVATRVDSRIEPMALIENEEAIQAALMQVVDALIKGTLDLRRASLVLKALNIAVKNSRRVRFDTREDEMVREVPNYAQQYLIEHPEATLTPALQPATAPENGNHESDALRQAESLSRPCRTNLGEALHAVTPPPDEAPRAIAPQRDDKRTRADLPSLKQKEDCHPEQGAFCLAKDLGEAPRVIAPPRDDKRARADLPFTSRQAQQWQDLSKLEACVEGALRGNLGDLKTAFRAIGLGPKPRRAISRKRE